jgi:hypothetical protein
VTAQRSRSATRRRPRLTTPKQLLDSLAERERTSAAEREQLKDLRGRLEQHQRLATEAMIACEQIVREG